MGRNKRVSCQKCLKVMRSDDLKTHMKQHEDGKFQNESFCASSLSTSKTSLDNESIISSVSASYEVSSTKEEELRKILKRDDEEYKYKLAQGKILYQSMYDMDIAEESLRPEFKEMLDLYRKQREYMNINEVILRPWQQSLLEHMKATDREIIWVIGKKGNEGKTFFQKYMESKYGWSKVICGINLKLKGGSICQLLRKRSLMTTDIFLFDVGKAKTEEGINYDVLESIKNGWITADKYNSEQFRCHTPNTVVVFSNEKPDIKEAVKDRWRILQIKEDDLIDISKRYTNKM